MKRVFLYLDVLVIGIFAISLSLLVRDAYVAGYWENRELGLHNLGFWAMMRDAAFLVASLAWVFFRYFKDKVTALQNPWA
ncbi:MAG: hypothetical protein ACYDCK_09495 [Thermoplasmatota archaeon]